MTKRTAALALAATKDSALKALKRQVYCKKKKVAPETPKKVNTTTTKLSTNSPPTTISNQKENPWFTIFKKSDEQYQTYMATESGTEKRG